MNFVIFPMFFASSALYPLWLVQQSSPLLFDVCRANIFTVGAILAYDPARGLLILRRGDT